MESFLERGTDVNARDVSCKTPMGLAAKTGNIEMAHLLIERSAEVDSWNNFEWTPLHSASRWTPIHISAANGHLKIVELLLERGANVYCRNEESRTHPN
jgi:ankyrin repeat protein